MPVNFQQVQTQVHTMGEAVPRREKALRERRELALGCLIERASQIGALRARVELARNQNPGLRCAVPVNEPLDTHQLPCQGDLPLTLLAADGSQINPDRHESVEFSLVNVGAIQMRSGTPPRETIQSRLLYHDELFTATGMIGEEVVALKRDLEERRVLVDLVRAAGPEAGPVVTLTDGQLELFREPKETPEFSKAFEAYLGVLQDLCNLGAATAGYVERPHGDLVVRLLELTQLADADLRLAGRVEGKYRGVRDADLFSKILTLPGERSAVFAIQSQSSKKFQDDLALHFFYLNVGRPGFPHMARVELPAWVVNSPTLLEGLHATLLTQCHILGNRPYPYVLHRAHEVAVVTLDDKLRVVSMIEQEMIRQGELPEKSYKQSAKDLQGRTRY
jgi:hypothetical protein